ncbi:hypothetical protein QBZ16_002503 [Prototheca wickerhamii]|uniref:MICOS complex subunit MIC19 n=1 Tax=Prototheca wickerhamii TaxID=3111 RepID=A0AAD9INZ1_PROWI|nr:hypothetical protein QBZ16_002503 [Prototheca wickerhamii]
MGQHLSRNKDRKELESGVRVPCPEEQEAREVASVAKQDRALAHALEQSHRVGRMLLKAEDAELAQVQKLADELIASEYNAPSKPVPCKDAAKAAKECYLAHASNPLACAAAVDAYAQCTSQHWKPSAVAA